MEEEQENQEMQQRIHQQQLMIEQQRQEELLRLQQTALVEKQREEQERQMLQRRQEEELFRLQQEALIEKQREEDMMRHRMAAPPPGTAPTVLPPPMAIPSTIPAPGPGIMPPGIDVSGSPIGGLSGPNLAPPPPQLRGPPPSVAMPPPPGMEPLGMGPPGVDSDEDTHSDGKLPSLLSLKVDPPVEVKEVKLPIALEQALAFKTERAKQIGVQPEDYVKLENIPEAPPAPVITRSGLVDEVEDEDEEDQQQP